jgi:ATP-dependent 26S proteasome regulatory subunit
VQEFCHNSIVVDRQLHCVTVLTFFDVFKARSEIMKVYTRTKPVEHVDLEELTRLTEGFTGADLENLCNEVSLIFSFRFYSS